MRYSKSQNASTGHLNLTLGTRNVIWTFLFHFSFIYSASWLVLRGVMSTRHQVVITLSRIVISLGILLHLSGFLSRPWHLINPVPLHPIASTPLPPIPPYVPTFSDYLYSLCIATDRWALCLVCLPIWLLNMFLFTIPVTLCSHPIILTNTIHLGESAMNITRLTHHAAWAVLVVGLPDPPSITPYILQ